MEARLKVLALVVQKLDLPVSVETIEDRMSLQKAIYLLQENGINLGYSYGWYLKGPYSPRLTRDYYELSADPSPVDGVLKESVLEKIKNVRGVMDRKPDGLSMAHWLELCASQHYLKNKSNFPDDKVKEKFGQQKPHLVAYLDLI